MAIRAIVIMPPSRTMNELWLFAREPSNPPDSSAQRKMDRMMIATVATAIAIGLISFWVGEDGRLFDGKCE